MFDKLGGLMSLLANKGKIQEEMAKFQQQVAQITAEGTVILDIKIQRREPAAGLNIAEGRNVPLITRDAQTRLMVRDGGTAIIGGIFKLTANDGQSMIPGLWKIPLLGALFRNKTTQENTDELMIFITPRVMKTL